jgi:ADP-heptose:LPS heptosyltransferase
LRVVFHVGASTSAKRWPAEHWRRLLEYLSADGRAVVVLVGTADDSQTARAVLGFSPPDNATDWTGRFTIDELAAVLQQADVVVGADSGPAHLAAAVGTPVVALFSGTNNVQQWQPRGQSVCTLHNAVPCAPCHQRACPLAGHPCMRGIHPDNVMKTLDGLLPEQRPRDEAAAAPNGT